MLRDISQRLFPQVLVPAATLSADPTPTAVDLGNAQSAMILLDVGVGGITFTGTNKIEFVLTHSDDNSTFVNVTDADMVGVTGITGGIIKSFTAAKAAASVDKFGYKGRKRYLKLLPDFSGTHATGTPISAVVVTADPASIAPA